MASLLKKTFAVVLAIGLVLSCLTVNAAAAAPTINVTTDYINYDAAANTAVSVDIYTENFDVIYGAQFTINVPTGFTDISIANNSGLTWTENSNYKIDGNTIKFVDVRVSNGFNITLNATCTDATAVEALNFVTITDTYFIDANEAEYTAVVVNLGGFSVTNHEPSTPVVPEKVEGYFIPFGSVTNNGEYVTKNEDGTFAAEGETVSYFRLPGEEGVTTFGVSEKVADDNYAAGVQFGSYAIDTTGKTFGTIVVSGDLDAFKTAYAASFADDKAFYNRFVELCSAYSGKTLKLGYGTEDAYIKVACVKRTTYMWKGTVGESEHRQYALRVINVPETSAMYYAIGYNTADGTNYSYSETVQKYVK
ncbi:MAG: hypothetical protein IJZ75_01590 [Clostridia bacterium]|nr:hypothetical protein [Clostridia bacterium]